MRRPGTVKIGDTGGQGIAGMIAIQHTELRDAVARLEVENLKLRAEDAHLHLVNIHLLLCARPFSREDPSA